MSEETQAPEGEEQKPEAPAEQPEAQPKAKRKAAIIAPAEGHKVYVSTEKHTVAFDIMIAGEIITGQWSARSGYVEFAVPEKLVKGFEKHFHFVAGNVVAAD